jgi:hypothetical protein
MSYTIEQVLGDQYLMFYHPALHCDLLHPTCDIHRSIAVINHELATNGRILTAWPYAHQDEIARLLWVNWMYQRLGVEPIRKPILVHKENNKFVVDCGDTRLMSLNLLVDPGTVSVITTVRVDQADQYQDWKPIRHNRDLVRATGFARSAHIDIRPAENKQYAIEWLEIGDETTAHHLHDVDQRVQMMQRYLDTQPKDFEFDINWARSSIDWDCYAN